MPGAKQTLGKSPGKRQGKKHPGTVVDAARARSTSKEENPNTSCTHHPPRMPQDPGPNLLSIPGKGRG